MTNNETDNRSSHIYTIMSDTNGRRTGKAKASNTQTASSAANSAKQQRDAVKFILVVRPSWNEDQATEFCQQYDNNMEMIQEKLDEVFAGMTHTPTLPYYYHHYQFICTSSIHYH
jgi:stalled ribosome rescue protein Dom34